MQPVPEVREALDRLSALLGTGMDLPEYLDSVAKVAQTVVPSCVGVSITVVVDGEPYTITATNPAIPAVDATQNLSGGPCVEARGRLRRAAELAGAPVDELADIVLSLADLG